MRRSRSSLMVPVVISGSESAWRRVAWAWRSSRELSRRRRSIARLRAVVVIHPPGLGGTPSTGHRSLATRNASWTASSATSMLPKRRTRVATTRPDSSRKTLASAVVSTAGTATDSGGLVLEGPDLDRAHAGRGRLGGEGERLVEVGRLDHPVAAEVLLGLEVGA